MEINKEVSTMSTISVRVFGPNLSSAGQRKGDQHVHAADCADCKFYGPGRKYGGEDNGFVVAASSPVDVATFCFPPSDFDYDPTSDEIDIYLGDIYFAPCVKFNREV